jgi:ATP-dependent Lhr-like helicase
VEGRFQAPVEAWFRAAFGSPTDAQARGWDAIITGASTLILAPTGSGKTLAAFLAGLDRLMFSPVPAPRARCRILYVSPLKALAVDVDRNLRGPLAGITREAERQGVPVHVPTVAVRTGDTPAADRARFQRHPADILITTPESLFLLLTSQAREVLRSIELVIIDEIHALVPTKRGAHLALSLERLAALTPTSPQRIGLSATQRPLDEVAAFLGGWQVPARRRRTTTARSRAAMGASTVHDEFEATTTAATTVARPVAIVDAGSRKPLSLRIEVPVEDLSRVGEPVAVASGPTSAVARTSIWSAIHPRLLDLIRAHRSTLIFVNSRRLAERLAGSVNELAGEVLCRAHHGSLAREQRTDIEDRLKAGTLRALVATSSLELGIDMGAIDLVVQVEAPPSVASGMQRIGRAGHQVGAESAGVVFPKFRGDLLACAAVASAMFEGRVEATRYPRNPLDVLAQQIVAMVAMDDLDVDEVWRTVRQAAPFHALSRAAFDGVLDMLSGRYPSDEFAELRPRLTWDRTRERLKAREGTRRLVVANAGTIPDRGLYGVFLAGAGRDPIRVGELDEEMVFESRAGEVFVLGASSWRIDEITHDRVLVTPAPGEPGKTPFWRGDRPGRPLELGLEIGTLTRDLARASIPAALSRLTTRHGLEAGAAENLVRYIHDQATTSALPDAETIVIERGRDDLGDWRVCLLSPRGSRIHAPWCMAIVAKIRRELGLDVETMWTDDGVVVRFPDADAAPDPQMVLPDPDEVEALVVEQLGATALFAARFRENAGRALLLPKRRPGRRAPLWQQRKKATDLMAVASRFGSFPMILETYRECLRDVFDMPALVETLRAIRSRAVQVRVVDPPTTSPFAASVMFGYVANFLYDGDAPPAERRAQALAVDQSQLRELIGDAELRELLDVEEIAAVELELQRLAESRHARSADAVHDLLREVGDLSDEEIVARTMNGVWPAARAGLQRDKRIVSVQVAGDARWVAVEDMARYRDALGVVVPRGLPAVWLEPTPAPWWDLAARYARTHAPFVPAQAAARFGVADTVIAEALRALQAGGRVVEGEFTPGRSEREWCDAGVLRQLRRRSLARLRKQVAAVEPPALVRAVVEWQGIGATRRGPDALLDVIEQLQGAPIVASLLEREILPARLRDYEPDWLDTLVTAGEVVWVGLEPLGHVDGRLALFLTDHAPTLMPTPASVTPEPDDSLPPRILGVLRTRGALFFHELHAALGGGFPGDVVDALWSLVWQGRVTNDAMFALRARVHPPKARERRTRPTFRSRRQAPAAAEGRWSLTPAIESSATVRMAARARQLLARHGVLTREAVAAEGVSGGFSAIYPALRAMDEAGQVRRGYFVSGLGATQFAQPGALDVLRARRDADTESPQVVALAATDPACLFGTAIPWPIQGAQRVPGARVVIVDGTLAVYVARGQREITTWLPADEPERSRVMRAASQQMVALGRAAGGMVIAAIDGHAPLEHPLAASLLDAGFVKAAGSLHLPVSRA